jgi:hypothetical protein
MIDLTLLGVKLKVNKLNTNKKKNKYIKKHLPLNKLIKHKLKI